MSAFGGKADMSFAGSPLSRSLLGVKRTWAGAVRMSAFDPKRTSPQSASLTDSLQSVILLVGTGVILALERLYAPARFHQRYCWLRGRMAAYGARAAAGHPGHRLSQQQITRGVRERCCRFSPGLTRNWIY